MKNYLKIQNVREHDVVVNKSLILPANISTFRENDTVSVTELLCGLHAHVRYNIDTGKLDCFSKSTLLSKDNTLCGFYDYARKLDIEPFKRYDNYEFYGEWLVPNDCCYDRDKQYQWYLFSVYNHETNKWMPQSFVKGFATKYQLNYVHELYFGPFLGWDHVYGLSNMPSYGPCQRGVVIKNQTALDENKSPHVLKYIVSDKKVVACDSTDATYLSYKANVFKAVNKMVTKKLVMVVYKRLSNDGILPSVITKFDMDMVSKILPKEVYKMCSDNITESGYLGKYAVMHKTMNIVKTYMLK